jgi:hypothetical protein
LPSWTARCPIAPLAPCTSSVSPHLERVLQPAQGGHADTAHHRRLRSAHAGRNRRHEIGVDADVLGVETTRRVQETGGEDALPDRTARHALTDGRDRPGPFRAEHVRKRRRHTLHLRIAALTLEGIPRANTRDLEPDQNLSTAGRGHRHFAFVQLLGTAEAVDHHRPHPGGLADIRIRHATNESADGGVIV